MAFKYAWLHIPTGTTGKRDTIQLSRHIFLEKLNSWNRMGENWKYWEIS